MSDPLCSRCNLTYDICECPDAVAARARSNNPPIEVSREDCEFLLGMMERDMGQGLALLTLPGASEEMLRKLVDMMEEIRPVRDRMKEAMK